MLFVLGLFVIVATTTPDARPSNPPTPSPAVAKKPPQAKPGDQRREPDRSQQGTERDPFFVKVIPAPKSDAETAQDAQERAEKASSDWWTVRFAGAAVFVGIIQSWVFYIQANRLKQTIIKMDEVAKDASTIGQAQVRAYVSIAAVTVEMREICMFGSHFADEPRFRLKINNTGNSPAIRFRIREEVFYAATEAEADLRGGRGFHSSDEGRGLPNGTTEIELNSLASRLNAQDRVQFDFGELQMVATFNFDFKDVFGRVFTDASSFRVKFTADTLRGELPMIVHGIDAETTARIAKKHFVVADGEHVRITQKNNGQ